MSECWNLRPQRPVNQIDYNRNRPWQEERSGSRPNSNYNPRRNFNKRHVPINFPNRPSRGRTNGPPNWNGPPYNANSRNYNSNNSDKRKIPVCYRCQELGHYANECPNPRKSQDYVPLCGNCKTAGHPTDECTEPKKDYQSNERDWKKGKHVQIQEDNEARGSRNVNHVQHTIYQNTSPLRLTVNAVTTRSKRVVDPLLVPNDNSDEKSLSYESQTNGDPLIHLPPPQEKAKGAVNSTPTVIHHVPVVTPATLPQRVPNPDFSGLRKAPLTGTRPSQETIKLPPYEIISTGRGSRKTASRKTRVMELATGLHHYDIISDLDNIIPQITMRQLLAIAPHCRSKLSSSMIRKKPKIVDIHDVSSSKDPEPMRSMLLLVS